MNIHTIIKNISYNKKMVKNTGGNKTKGQARKYASGPKSDVLRVSEDECEVYAIVDVYLGNNMCNVLCIDNVTRLCHIRGKFRGRGKRDNNVVKGSWILVGLREWDLEKKEGKSKKLQECDLLEVYSDLDKDRLKNNVKTVNWRLFTKNENDNNQEEEEEDNEIDEDEFGFAFVENKNAEIEQLIATELANKGVVTNIVMDNNDWIDADDI